MVSGFRRQVITLIFGIDAKSVVLVQIGRASIDADGQMLSGGRIKARKKDHAQLAKLYS